MHHPHPAPPPLPGCRDHGGRNLLYPIVKYLRHTLCCNQCASWSGWSGWCWAQLFASLCTVSSVHSVHSVHSVQCVLPFTHYMCKCTHTLASTLVQNVVQPVQPGSVKPTRQSRLVACNVCLVIYTLIDIAATLRPSNSSSSPAFLFMLLSFLLLLFTLGVV